MNKSQLLELLERLNIHPSRKLGQNFLLDPNMLSALVQDACVCSGERVLEIGPGPGILTHALLEAGCDVTAVELDHRLAGYLESEYSGRPGFRLVQGDACRLDFGEVMGGEPYRCIANLPYSCSTPFLANIYSSSNSPVDLCVLLQREMAERLCASHGTKAYGLPTVRLALRYDVRILRMVPPAVFFPSPEVWSAFVRMERNHRCDDLGLRRAVDAVASAAFAQRRKKALGAVSRLYPGVDVAAGFKAAGLETDVRADGISVSAYLALTRWLEHSKYDIDNNIES